MAQDSKIGWTHHTANYTRGCTHAKYTDENGDEHAHPGCLNCYAEKQVDNGRFKLGLDLPIWGQGDNAVRILGGGVWQDVLKWNRAAEKAGERHRVFTMSLGDIFEEFDGPIVDNNGKRLYRCAGSLGMRGHTYLPENDVQTRLCPSCANYSFPLPLRKIRDDIFATIGVCENLDHLLLTKRPQNVPHECPIKRDGVKLDHAENVWLGVSVSDQDTLEWALRELAKIPKWWKYTFLSVEPMLEMIDLSSAFFDVSRQTGRKISDVRTIDWLIIGGESSQQFPARPFPVEAASLLVTQAAHERISVFFKQFGDKPEIGYYCDDDELREWALNQKHTVWQYPDTEWDHQTFGQPCPSATITCKLSGKGEDPSEWPEWARVQQFPE